MTKARLDPALAWRRLQAIEALLANIVSGDSVMATGRDRGYLPSHPSDAGRDSTLPLEPISEGHAHLRHLHGHPALPMPIRKTARRRMRRSSGVTPAFFAPCESAARGV